MQGDVQAGIDKAKSEPNNFEAQMKAAELYYQIQRYDSALEYLKNANKLQPDNYEVIVQLGNTNFDAEHYEEAENGTQQRWQRRKILTYERISD